MKKKGKIHCKRSRNRTWCGRYTKKSLRTVYDDAWNRATCKSCKRARRAFMKRSARSHRGAVRRRK